MYARCAKFLIFSANSSADSLRRLVRARSSARCASSLSGGHIGMTSVLARNCNPPVGPRSCLLGDLRLDPSGRIPGKLLVLQLSNPDGARWPQIVSSRDGIGLSLFHQMTEPSGSMTGVLSMYYCQGDMNSVACFCYSLCRATSGLSE